MKKISINVFLVIAICMISSKFLIGQQTGTVTQSGFTFTIPDGWVGQLANDIYIMASNTEPGLVVLSYAEIKSLNDLKTQMQTGLTDNYSYGFNPVGSITEIEKNMVGCTVEGFMESEKAKGSLIGIYKENKGSVLILALTTPELFSARYEDLSEQVAKSLKFPEVSQVATATPPNTSNAFVQQFTGVKLTYMNSYYSSSYTDGGVSGGYSDREIISLCSTGYFTYKSNSEVSGGGNYSSMLGYDRSQGDGTWKVTPTGANKGILELKFNNGQVKKYNLEINSKNETYLNGYRYYRTTGSSGAEYAPDC